MRKTIEDWMKSIEDGEELIGCLDGFPEGDTIKRMEETRQIIEYIEQENEHGITNKNRTKKLRHNAYDEYKKIGKLNTNVQRIWRRRYAIKTIVSDNKAKIKAHIDVIPLKSFYRKNKLQKALKEFEKDEYKREYKLYQAFKFKFVNLSNFSTDIEHIGYIQNISSSNGKITIDLVYLNIEPNAGDANKKGKLIFSDPVTVDISGYYDSSNMQKYGINITKYYGRLKNESLNQESISYPGDVDIISYFYRIYNFNDELYTMENVEYYINKEDENENKINILKFEEELEIPEKDILQSEQAVLAVGGKKIYKKKRLIKQTIKKKKLKIQGKMRNIYTGTRGGRYYIKNKRKVYI